MVSEEQVYDVLRECYDPELPVNIVDLGLVYAVKLEGAIVSVRMTLTAPGCRLGSRIAQEIEDKLLAIPGVKDAAIEIVWDPPWTPAMMSAAARKQLGID
jgi:metal-sulfur cluster biosynthetic enzyme